jgi:hypothetical protein
METSRDRSRAGLKLRRANPMSGAAARMIMIKIIARVAARLRKVARVAERRHEGTGDA